MKGDYYYWVDPGAFNPLNIRRLWASGLVEDFPTRPKVYAIDDNIKQPYLDEFILGLDRELFPGFTLSGTVIYRKNKDLVETVSRDGVFVPVKGYVGITDPQTGNFPVSTGQKVTLFDYLNPNGCVLSGGGSPPQGTMYIRRWSVEPLPTNPNNTLILQVLVFRNSDRGDADAGNVARLPEETRLMSVKTRKMK